MEASERETNIQWSGADNETAHIYTAQPSIMLKLAKHPQAKLLKRHEDESGRVTGEEWELPKALVSIRTRRVLTEAQKASLRKALKARRAAQEGHFGLLGNAPALLRDGPGPPPISDPSEPG